MKQSGERYFIGYCSEAQSEEVRAMLVETETDSISAYI